MDERDKLLERARNSQAGWRFADVDAFLSAFGFRFREGANHRLYYHSQYRELFMSLPRHRDVKPVYVHKAMRLAERVKELEAKNE